jgi:hypothetical protein
MHALFRAAAAALAAAALAASLASPALAQDEDLKRKVEELEKRLREVEGRREAAPAEKDLDAAIERYLKTRRPGEPGDTGRDRDYVLGGVSRPANDRFRFGGYVTVLYRSPDDPTKFPSFEGLRVVPQFSFDISEGIEFATEIEFERGGADASFLADNEVLVEFAEVRFQVSEAFVPKAGILLIPFLRYNLYHDDPIWNLQDRPFTATRVFKAAFQQPGVGAEGVLPFGNGHSFNYNVVLSNGPDDGVTNSAWSGARQDFKADNNHDKAAWVRAGAAPRLALVDAADFGLSFARAAMDADERVRMTAWGVDAKLTKGRFDLVGEWTAFHYARPSSQPAATFPSQTEGAFVQVDTRLLRGLPKSKNGIVGPSSELILAVRWEYADLNERVTGAAAADDSRALTIGLAFRFTPKTVLRIERKEERTSFRGAGRNDLSQWVASLSTYF